MIAAMSQLRFLAAAVLLFAAAVLLQPVAWAGTTPEKPPVPVTLEPTTEQHDLIMNALAEVKAGRADRKQSKAEVELKFARCLVDMEQLQHDDFIPHIELGLKSKDPIVLAAAIRAAATHDLTKHAKSIRKLMKRKPKKSKGSEADWVRVQVSCIDYLGRLGIEGEEEWIFDEHLRKVFIKTSDFSSNVVQERLRAAMYYIGSMKWKPCVKFMITQLQEPIPKNPNDPNNPPASYWKARYTLWQATEGWTRWVLKEVTGQEYRSMREWQAWYRKNEKEYGKKKR